MTSIPKHSKGSRACITVAPDGVKIYGNAAAFESLARIMSWIASAAPSENFECHLPLSLQDDDAIFGKADNPNAWVVIDPALRNLMKPRTSRDMGFEVTFMALSEGQLDELQRDAGSVRAG
jgi:hypothetical protein